VLYSASKLGWMLSFSPIFVKIPCIPAPIKAALSALDNSLAPFLKIKSFYNGSSSYSKSESSLPTCTS